MPIRSTFTDEQYSRRQNLRGKVPIIIAIVAGILAILGGIIVSNMQGIKQEYYGADKFGIKKIFPTLTDGTEWFANWDDGIERIVLSGERDPNDIEFIVRGDGEVIIDGNGVAKMNGETPRMYVSDPARIKKWNNVEVTFYAKRVGEFLKLSYQGFVVGTRSEHQDVTDETPCLGKTYYGRMTYDGRITFQKEIVHHVSYSDTQPEPPLYAWNTPDKQLPKDQWVGIKFIVRTVDNDRHVNLQLYRDMTDGANGGSWDKLIEYTDAGGWQQQGSDIACPGSTPDEVLLDPGTSTFIRNDGIEEAQYKWFSVREIDPFP